MTELNELYGQANRLPGSIAQRLEDLSDDLTALPMGLRSPNIRIWGNPATDTIILQGIQINYMDFVGMSNVNTLYINSAGLLSFPPITHLSSLNYLEADFNQFAYVPDLSPMTGLIYVSMTSGDIERVESLANLANLEDLNVNFNSLTELPPLIGLAGLVSLQVRSNNMEAPAIDNILLQLDDLSPPGGSFLDYSGNPGASGDQRSAEASAAKASLISAGWTVTI